MLPLNRRQALLGSAALLSMPMGMSWQASAASDVDLLRIRVDSEPTVLDPPFWQSAGDLWTMEPLLPRLITFIPGKKWEWAPYAAETIEQTDDKTISFKLREGLKWTNGFGDLTAEDVKFSFERFLDKDLQAPNAGNWALLDHVEVTGRLTGKIHFTKPSAVAFAFVLPYDGGQIVCKEAVLKAGGKYGVNIPASAGPYKLVQHIPNQKIIYERDDNWPGPKGQFQRIEQVPITDPKTAENAVLAGELDWSVISLSSVPTLRDNLPEHLALEIMPTPNYFWLGLTMANPDLEDVRVRKAIHLAIDRDAIINGAFFGVAPAANGLALEGMLGHLPDPAPARNVEEAKRLLAEAGVSGLTLDLETVAETDKITAAQIIQGNLAEIGITVNINNNEGGAFWSLGEQKGKKLQLHLTEYTTAAPDMSWSTQWFLPEQAGSWNWEYFISEDFKNLHLAALSELDVKKRDQLLQDAQKLMNDSYTFYWIVHVPRAVLYNKKKIVPSMKPNAEPRLELFTKA